MAAQTTSNILMIRPVAFAMNAETAKDNHYQNQQAGISATKAQEEALKEFDEFVV
ncbi:MAG: amidinotransferase, partial [Flavobacteriales bacterium]|nr:amidinotransferase [Flavobacteriales bacterium]